MTSLMTSFGRAIFIFACASVISANSFAEPTTSSMTRTDIEKIVHDYLISHPEVLMEAAQALQKKQVDALQSQAQTTVSKKASVLFQNSASPSYGKADSHLVVLEFSDYQCGHCKSTDKALQKLQEKNPNIRFILKELPVFGPNSEFAARAALAVFKMTPAQYAPFHHALMALKNPLEKDKVLKAAQDLHIDTAQLQKIMSDASITQELNQNQELANDIGVGGTPTLIIANPTNAKKTSDIKMVLIPGEPDLKDLEDAVASVK